MIKKTFLSASLVALSLGLLSPSAHAALPALTEVAASCAAPDYTKPHNTFYVDPVHGSAAGDGSAAHPWNSLQTVMTTGLVSTMPGYWDNATRKMVKAGTAKSPIHPGDVIQLMSGDYGNVVIQGYYGAANNVLAGYDNSDFITIQAAPGQKPVLGELRLSGGNKWVFRGLTIQNITPNLDGKSYGYAVAFTGPHKDIIFDNNVVGAAFPVQGWTQAEFLKNWTQADWLKNAPNGIMDYGSGYNGANCVTITHNNLTNVGFGIGSQRSNNVLIGYNTVNYFDHDGFDYGSNNMVIKRNVLTNRINAGDLASLHPDFMQGQPYVTSTYNPAGGTTTDHLSNILIDRNICIRQTDPNMPFVDDTNMIQGIDTFDGWWENVTVTNNVIVTTTYQGISYSGAKNVLIANNTLLSDGLNKTVVPWITVGPAKAAYGGFPSSNVVIRNNITNVLIPSATTVGMTVDHNLVVPSPFAAGHIGLPVDGKVIWTAKAGTYGNNNVITAAPLTALFAKFDSKTTTYDLHLKAGSPAIGTGNAVDAPAVDILGNKRSVPFDVGAFAYTTASVASGAVPGTTIQTVTKTPVK